MEGRSWIKLVKREWKSGVVPKETLSTANTGPKGQGWLGKGGGGRSWGYGIVIGLVVRRNGPPPEGTSATSWKTKSSGMEGKRHKRRSRRGKSTQDSRERCKGKQAVTKKKKTAWKLSRASWISEIGEREEWGAFHDQPIPRGPKAEVWAGERRKAWGGHF